MSEKEDNKEKSIYLVETVGVIHYRYLVEAFSEEEAEQKVESEIDTIDTFDTIDLIEFSSKWLGETVHSVETVDLDTEEKYQDLIRKYEEKEDVKFWLDLDFVLNR